jgi:hypothetical protein
MSSKSERSGDLDQVPTEQKVSDIFSKVAETLGQGRKRFSGENVQKGDLAKAVGHLGTEQLVELITGAPLEKIEGPGIKRLGFSMDLWSDEETARAIHGFAESTYIAAQDKTINELLGAKRITATAHEGVNYRQTIKPSDGLSIYMGSDNPKEVTGTFKTSNVSLGEVVLAIDQPNDFKYWFIRMGDLDDAGKFQPHVDLHIDEAPSALEQ